MVKEYVEYLHVKDAVTDGTVVPAGKGEGHLPEIIADYLARGGETVTLEPHLNAFTGLDKLENGESLRPGLTVYKNNDESFDAAVDHIMSTLAAYNGYVENSSVSGTGYKENDRNASARYATYTLRVPAENLDAYLIALRAEEGIRMIKQSSSSNEITGQYYDITTRIATLEIERDSLQQMLAGFTDYSDIGAMLSVQERLYNVIEEIEALKTQLKLYGFLSGGADGDFGANTDRALKAFQQYQYDMGLIEVTPSPTPVPTPTPEPTPIVTPAPTIPVEGTITPEDGEAAASETPAETEEPAADPTPDPTPEAPVFEPDGVVTDELKAMLTDGSFQLFREEVGKGSNGWEVLRLQYRLTDLQYHWDAIDGVFGGNTEEALKCFQKRNKLAETGIADKETQMLLFSAAAVKSDKPKYPYLLKISVADQRVYAYKWVNGSYSKLMRTMVCSTGTRPNAVIDVPSAESA